MYSRSVTRIQDTVTKQWHITIFQAGHSVVREIHKYRQLFVNVAKSNRKDTNLLNVCQISNACETYHTSAATEFYTKTRKSKSCAIISDFGIVYAK
jgi:hypothetical protein